MDRVVVVAAGRFSDVGSRGGGERFGLALRWDRRERGERSDLVAHGAAESDEELGDLGLVPLLAGDAVGDVEQRDAESVSRGLVLLELVAQWPAGSAAVDDGA